MKLFLQKEKPEGEVFLNLPDDEDLNAWLKRLRAMGVPQGALDLEKLKDLNQFDEKPGGEHLIARGRKPNDEGVILKFHFEAMTRSNQDGEGNTDFFSLGYGIDVMEGQLLAEQTIMGPGKEGYNVLGTKLAYNIMDGDDQLQYNHNVYIEKEGKHTKFYSRVNGVLFNDRQDILNVSEIFEVKGAVGFKTGNISTSVDVLIEGDVKAGFHVRSGKSITVKGAVEKGAILEADGDIIVEGGVSPGTRILSKGDVYLKFAQGSHIESEGNIRVASYLYDSFAYAAKTFYCKGGGSAQRGAVIGGKINAFEGVILQSVGSNNALTTLIAGIHHQAREEYKELEELKESLKSDLKRLIRQLPVDLLDPNFKSKMKALPEPEKKVSRQKIEQIIEIRREIEMLGTRISDLGPKALENFSKSVVSIEGFLCPDVRIVLGEDYKLVQEDLKGLEFRLIQGKISGD